MREGSLHEVGDYFMFLLCVEGSQMASVLKDPLLHSWA